jgi:hypothetical protein
VVVVVEIDEITEPLGLNMACGADQVAEAEAKAQIILQIYGAVPAHWGRATMVEMVHFTQVLAAVALAALAAV